MRTSSSGFKRGLATVAVSALAVTGLPFLMSSASAEPLTDQVPASDVVLVAPAANASIKADGANTTVHLLAVGGANVNQVRFEYKASADAAFTPIATVSRSNGAFSTEWTPPASIYNAAGTTVQAVALNNTNNPIDTEGVTGQVSTTRNSIDIANAPGSGVGVFNQPYSAPNNLDLGVVSGTTSNVDVSPTIQLSAPLTNGTVLTADYAEPVQAGDTVRDWSGSVDFTGYDFAGNPDEAAVRAFLTGGTGSDDAEAVSVYEQTISTVNVTADPAQVQGAATTTGVVTVLDGQGKPIAGAEVVQETGNVVKYTDSKGEARFPGLDGTAEGKQHFFYVNTTDADAYDNGIDFRRSVTVQSYAPQAENLTAASKDGAAFDFDENAAGDITITVKDQNNNPLAGEDVFYSWNVAPFATTVGFPKDLAEAKATDNGDGTYTVAFPGGQPAGTYTLSYYINADGTPGQGNTDPTGADLVVKAGQAALTWKDGATAQAPASTTATFEGALELEDGTPLPGRTVDLTWTGTTDAVLAAQGAQPAGTTRNSNTSATAVTKADGTFGVAIVDPPASPKVNELNGDLVADTAFTPASPVLDVDFLVNTAPATIEVSKANLIDAKATPGRPVDLDVTVKNSDGLVLTDVPVTVKVDHGFLSPNAESAADLVADPAPAQDGLYGEWKSEGTETEVTTDDAGVTGAVVAIEDDAAFATSPTVTTTVTITAGDVTKTEPVVFTSTDPLNGGDVRLELAAAADQTVSVLPKAPTTETVKYDLFVEDQFGNLVDGESVTLSDDLAGATINGTDNNKAVDSQLENEAPAVTLASSVEGSQTVSAEWVVDSNTWTDADTNAAGFQAARDSDNEDTTLEGDAAPVDWYAIDYAAGDYTITDNGETRNDVGDTVVVTYKAVDQNGEPIEGLQVNFFRAGPDDEQDGSDDAAVETNANGEAQYVFQGIKAGTAIIQAVVREPLPSTTIIPEAGVQHVVQFGTAKKAINAKLTARTKGNKDILTIKAPRAARGAKVVFYAEINGEVVKIGKARLNSKGDVTKRFKDRNGNRKTAYAAIVRATSRTLADTTNVRRVK